MRFLSIIIILHRDNMKHREEKCLPKIIQLLVAELEAEARSFRLPVRNVIYYTALLLPPFICGDKDKSNMLNYWKD